MDKPTSTRPAVAAPVIETLSVPGARLYTETQAALNQVKAGPKAQDLQTADAGVTTAQANLQATRDRLSLAKTQAEAQVQQAALMLTQAQARSLIQERFGITATGEGPLLVVDISPEHGTSLVHDLIPYRESETPA